MKRKSQLGVKRKIARRALEARKTVLSPAQVWRYINAPANTAFPLEYAFHLLGDVQHKHVLDLGCGTGEEIPALALCGAHVTGIDISPDLIALAQERIHREGVQPELRWAQPIKPNYPMVLWT